MPLPANFIYHVLPMQKGRPWLNWSLPRAARKDGIDAMFFPANDCWLLPFKPTLVALLDIAPATFLRKYLSPADKLQNDLQLAMMPFAARHVVTISNYSKKEILNKIPGLAQKISVVYCGVNKIFRPFDNRENKSEPYILFVSGFDRRKNLEGLLKAVKILEDRGRKVKLQLVGMTEPNQSIYYDAYSLVRQYQLERITAIEAVRDNDERMAYLYNSASMLVMPSFIEGFGLPVLEAMACGCPVACSNAASLPEVGGGAALYFDPNDPAQMATVMERILIEPGLRQKMIAKGYENVKRFGWDKMARELLKILKSVGQGRQEKAGR
jgi:glycosyltransferase involved in cell wall biosynthesis